QSLFPGPPGPQGRSHRRRDRGELRPRRDRCAGANRNARRLAGPHLLLATACAGPKERAVRDRSPHQGPRSDMSWIPEGEAMNAILHAHIPSLKMDEREVDFGEGTLKRLGFE